ncbi:MAG: hypothetical protein ABIL69_00425 [candidate division WOR-3 bacterium]
MNIIHYLTDREPELNRVFAQNLTDDIYTMLTDIYQKLQVFKK